MMMDKKRSFGDLVAASSSIPPSPPTKKANITADSSSFFCSSSSSTRYDIFLSFRGEDTRKNFTSHLFSALKHQGYNVFHDTLLPRGQQVSSELLKAIEESKLSIVVFSENYADSRWCLDELVKIMDCRRSSSGQIVLPVFYGVEPSNVRNQTGSYATLLTSNQFGPSDEWKAALKEAGNLSGLHLQNDSNRDEADFITKIVKEVMEKLDQPYLNVTDYPVGIESHVQELKDLLSLGTDDIHIVAIWGVGGIGKTTIAKAIFNKIYRSFEGSCFLADVGTTATQPDGIVTLQGRLISSVLKQNTPKIDDPHRGIEVIKQKLWCRKFLLVLDDVNHIDQLENLVVSRSWLPKGSRVIITTRDCFCVSSLNAKLYEPNPLNAKDSLNLFKWHAFGVDYPKQVFEELSKEVVDYAKGLPLVLKTLGPYMGTLKTIKEWRRALERLRVIPHDDVQAKLKLSFDSLHDREKELFLDIACFFIGKYENLVFMALDEKAPGYYPEFELKVLCNRCLVKIDYGKLLMHDMVRDMGREIVRQKSIDDPGKCSRLWYPQDALRVLKESLGTEDIESMVLELANSDKEEVVDVKAFAKMSNLRMVCFRNLNLCGFYHGIQSLDKLKWLSWYGFPLTCIPDNMIMQNLVALDLRNSRLRQLWKGTKVLNKLRFLDVSGSRFLTSTPDFMGVMNLEILCLSDCKNLVRIHPSIGCLQKLGSLDISGCPKLQMTPAGFKASFANLWNLFSSMLLWKSQPRSRESLFFSSSAYGQSCLKHLNLSNCNLSHVPIEIGSLESLVELDLSGNGFSSLQASVKNLRRLLFLSLNDCCELKSLMDVPESVYRVFLDGCRSLETVHITSNQWCNGLTLLVNEGTKFIDNMATNKGQALSKINCVAGLKTIPHWFNYRGRGPFISFVAPQRTSGSIIGWFVAFDCLPKKTYGYMLANVYNKTKGKMHTIFVLAFNYRISISYIQFSKHGIVVEGGDEIEILFMSTGWFYSCGLRLIYDNGDEDLEVDEQLPIQYTPNIQYIYVHDQDQLLVQYTTGYYKFSSPVFSKSMLEDIDNLDKRALFLLIRELVDGGGRGGIRAANEHRHVYHIIANAASTWYLQASRSSFLHNCDLEEIKLEEDQLEEDELAGDMYSIISFCFGF